MKTAEHLSATTTTRPESSRATRDPWAEAQRLNTRDWWLLDMLTEHQALTAQQITDLGYAPTRAKTVDRLRLLTAREVLARFPFDPADRGRHRTMCWCLGPTGAQIAAIRQSWPVPRPATVAARYQRLSTSRHMPPLIRANGFFADLAAWVQAHPGTDLREWWSPHGCLPITGAALYPKRYGHFFDHGRHIGFWLEAASVTTTLGRVIAKLDHYQRLAQSTGVGNVLVWMPYSTGEQRLHQRLARQPATGLTIATAVAGSGNPGENIWRIAGTTNRVGIGDLPATPRIDHPYEGKRWWEESVIHPPVHPIYERYRDGAEAVIDHYEYEQFNLTDADMR